MSSARITTDKYNTPGVLVNGRHYYLPRIESVSKVDGSTFKVVRVGGMEFTVWGGKKAGTYAHDWTIDGVNGYSDIRCTSLVDALKLIDGM